MPTPVAAIVLGVAVLLASLIVPVRPQFSNVFGDYSIGQIAHVLQSDASALYRRTMRRAGELATCPFGECCVPEFVIGDVKGKCAAANPLQ